MTSLKTQLWELIKSHKMPEDATGTPFEEQLMAENSISPETALVAIAEYKKFMYLCATRHERNVPSKAVDLVWHLHMQHSRDYWDRFCKALGRPVHHTPGGQGPEHLQDYKATVQAYRILFGTPPKGIWKQSNKWQSGFALVVASIFMFVGMGGALEGPDIVPAIIVFGFGAFAFVSSLNGMLPQGEYRLVFELDDPFADEDVGECSSGDGGGCGD